MLAFGSRYEYLTFIFRFLNEGNSPGSSPVPSTSVPPFSLLAGRLHHNCSLLPKGTLPPATTSLLQPQKD